MTEPLDNTIPSPGNSERHLIIDRIAGLGPVMAVLTVRRLRHARPLAAALVAGGVRALEVTLRTPIALDVIRIMSEVDGAIVGAGTVIHAKQVHMALDAGAVFGVSPGAPPRTLDACEHLGLAFIPGAATANEVGCLQVRGYRTVKFFPAEAAGGRAMLKALHAPFPDMKFCPTGGLNQKNASSYLELPNVACIGGSWMAPDRLVHAEAWSEITKGAEEVSSLASETFSPSGA